LYVPTSRYAHGMYSAPDVRLIILLLIVACGKDEGEYARCRSAEEAQMRCQVEYAEKFRAYNIPEWVKNRCVDYYPGIGCYYDSSKRHYW
jgi:hypothetical protein